MVTTKIVTEKEEKRRVKIEDNYNTLKGACKSSELSPRTKVFIIDVTECGTVIRKAEKICSYIIETHTNKLRRNRYTFVLVIPIINETSVPNQPIKMTKK